MVSEGTARGVQQQQGNASRASTIDRYSIPISPLVNNYFNYLLNYKFWCLLMRHKKKKGKRKWKARFKLWVLSEEIDSNDELYV